MGGLSTARWAGSIGPRIAALASTCRIGIAGLVVRLCDQTRQSAAALQQHRHGTWLLLFAAIFILLWLLAGWAGVSNGVGRGLLVGVATAAAVGTIFPLRRPAIARTRAAPSIPDIG